MKFERLVVHTDDRGAVFEPLDPVDLPFQQNAHIVINQPGAVRGNHYHLQGVETLIIIGPALVRIREDRLIRDVTVPTEEVLRFVFPPGVSHAVQNTGGQPRALAAFNTVAHNPAEPDLVMDELIPHPGRTVAEKE